MSGNLKLNTALGGSIALTPTNTASNITVTIPATTATLLNNSSGVMDIGSGQIYKDASGNVGIGTASPVTKLSVVNGVVSVAGATSGSGVVKLGDPTDPIPYVGVYRSAAAAIATSGNFLNLGGFDGIAFTTGPTQLSGQSERMRLDPSGNLLVGKTTSSVTTSPGVTIVDPDVSNTGVTVTSASGSGVDSGFQMYSTGAAAYRFYVTFNGQVFATNTTITGISDVRLKENIRDLDDGLEKVMALQPRKFDWKEGKGAGIKNARGFIAQEFETVFPDMIDEWKDPSPLGEEPYKAVNANLIPTLVKAIQEQQALITQLQADVAALKGAA
jgi:hypothetical protein